MVLAVLTLFPGLKEGAKSAVANGFTGIPKEFGGFLLVLLLIEIQMDTYFIFFVDNLAGQISRRPFSLFHQNVPYRNHQSLPLLVLLHS